MAESSKSLKATVSHCAQSKESLDYRVLAETVSSFDSTTLWKLDYISDLKTLYTFIDVCSPTFTLKTVIAGASTDRRPWKGALSLGAITSVRLRRWTRSNMSNSHQKRATYLCSLIMPIASNAVRYFKSSSPFDPSSLHCLWSHPSDSFSWGRADLVCCSSHYF